MPKPRASLDSCQNCTYWEAFPQRPLHRGVCHVISHPERFKNTIAFIALDRASHTVIQPAPGFIFAPVADFHCTLYKVK